jgi:hypothetical protein
MAETCRLLCLLKAVAAGLCGTEGGCDRDILAPDELSIDHLSKSETASTKQQRHSGELELASRLRSPKFPRRFRKRLQSIRYGLEQISLLVYVAFVGAPRRGDCGTASTSPFDRLLDRRTIGRLLLQAEPPSETMVFLQAVKSGRWA